MKRGFILFVGILALTLAPALVSAQYSGAFGLSGLPSMPSMFGGSGNCGQNAGPAFAPAVYFGPGFCQERNTSVSLTPQGNNQRNNSGNNGELAVRTSNGGWWLGTALPICLGENLSFVATGWYLFPVDSSAISELTVNGQQVIDGVESIQRIDPRFNRNNWNSQHNWWFVDGAFGYLFGQPSCGGGGNCFGSGFSLLLGLRYDYYTLSISDTENNFAFGGHERGDVTSRAWIPFVGFQTAYTDAVQSLKVRILGFPTILGTGELALTTLGAQRAEFDSTYNSGHFYEIFGEYSRRFFGASQAGIWARWNTARAITSGTVSLVNQPALDSSYDFSLNRSQWSLGVLVTLDFNSPF